MSVYDMWPTKVHRINHCKNSNWYAVINNRVIFQRYTFFGPSSHKVLEQDRYFCDMLLQNAFNLSKSNNKTKSILTPVYFKGNIA
jgi:hypothetical protein